MKKFRLVRKTSKGLQIGIVSYTTLAKAQKRQKELMKKGIVTKIMNEGELI